MADETEPFAQDRLTTIHRSRTGRSPYLAAVPPILLLVSVVTVGAFGPRPQPAPLATPAPALATQATPTAPPTPPPTPLEIPIDFFPTPSASPGISTEDDGLGRVAVDEASLHHVALTTVPIAVSGSRIFTRTDPIVEADLDQPGNVGPVGYTSGQNVAALAASGDRLFVLDADQTTHPTPCDPLGCPQGYHAYLVPHDGADPVEVGAFTSDFPILAAGTDSWAVTRTTPGRPQTTTIEVRADSGKLLWSTSTDSRVLDLKLGGSSLVAVIYLQLALASDGASDGPTSVAPMFLAVADATNRELTIVAPAESASISADGRYLAFEAGGCISVQPVPDHETSGGGPMPAETRCPWMGGLSYSSPSVDTGGDGPPNVVCLAGGPDGTRLIIQSQRSGDWVVVTNASNPVWATIQGDYVYWAEASNDRFTVYEFNLGTATFLFA